MEAGDGCAIRAFASLFPQELPVAIVNSRAVRRFAESMGRREQGAAIDAGMIAGCAR
jgi:transposase